MDLDWVEGRRDAPATWHCAWVEEERDAPVAVAPRQILNRQVARASEAGFVPYFGSELEFFLFNESYASASAKGYRDLDLSQIWLDVT